MAGTMTMDRGREAGEAAVISSTIPDAQRPPRVAYIMSRFPKLTETFVLYEMLAVENMGVAVDVYPLLRARDTGVHTEGASVWTKLAERFKPPRAVTVMHAEADALVARARFQPLVSPAILASQLHFLRRRPGAYLGALARLVRANWGSRRFLVGGLAFFPRTVHNARHMARDGVTHVHAHFASHPAAMAWVIHRLTGIPYSFTAHGSDLHVDRHMLVEKVADAAFVATVSEYNKRLIVDTCAGRLGGNVGDKIAVVRCGVDTTVFRPKPYVNGRSPSTAAVPSAGAVASADGAMAAAVALSTSIGPTASAVSTTTAAPAPFTILCIGTLYEVKGHRYLIEACRLLADRGVDTRCWLIGEGPYEARLTAQIADAGLGGRVELLGRRTRAEIADLLHRVDVLAVPSVPTADGRREGIPVVLVEAMASGVAVVASDQSGIPELVEDGRTGLLAPARDATKLADALERLARDPGLRRRLASAGRERVLAEYDIRGNAARLAARFGAPEVAA